MTAGRYVFWKSVVERHFIKADINNIEIADNIDRSLLAKHR